ncbi:gamma-glutamyl-gamma-aminobutyrate hydrolase family protein [Companilactobacillus mishanensis]|uniref:gamma-glutamyl-gamma-aminobutyrate hydrolase family protein n=1 Tax=Companilactobacillus mishanensis TaxID=2486008 RepID=UPI0012959C41|nr:gamma-glutamyl-gamma-aminobutyrate hydrolase family protein [Companilactobacillus mishanensis]MQS89086.1 gamma-glutamyl-gamma-aminobutyrate hydrolase family protein [Companilactobacillus mishanensis]
MSKLIGITADVLLDATSVINHRDADFVPRSAVNAILAAGGTPVSLPYLPADKVDPLINSLDGILFTGGPDVDPTFMGVEPIPQLGATDRNRDIFEIALVKKAVEHKLPILGMCRGAQVINVALGGTVYQDLSTQYDQPNLLKHHQDAPGDLPTHHVTISSSALQKTLGDTAFVNSRHHQAIRQPAPGLKIVATASDGVIEAVENSDTTVQAVQWHPENMWENYPEQLKLFKDFINRI